MLKCGEQNLAANTSEPAVSMDCRVKPGNDDMESRSRDAFFDSHPSYEQAIPKNLAAKNPTFVRSIQQWRAGSITVGRGTEERKGKRKRNAGRRKDPSALARGARPAGRARLPAFHCGSRQGDYSSPRLSTGHAS
jgi:hypothetical protein